MAIYIYILLKGLWPGFDVSTEYLQGRKHDSMAKLGKNTRNISPTGHTCDVELLRGKRNNILHGYDYQILKM